MAGAGIVRPLLGHAGRLVRDQVRSARAGGAPRDAAVAERLAVLADVLAPEVGRRTTDHATVAAALDGDGERTWLVYAVLNAELPILSEVVTLARRARLDGGERLLDDLVAGVRPAIGRFTDPWRRVRVLQGAVVVDVHHTAQTELATGIQRVARAAVRRWADDHDVVLVGWTGTLGSMRELTEAESATALHGESPITLRARAEADGAGEVLVPWQATYIQPELMAERPRALRVQALAAMARCTTGVIAYDCVPVSSAETAAEGMPAGFASNLSAVSRMDRIACISEAAAGEYRGWRSMLSGTGLPGPRVEALPIAVVAEEPTDEGLEEARRLLCVGAMPMVLVVGSHEPRKNHLAVLHAAELLWREGRRFSLAFVGGNAWGVDRFSRRAKELRDAGRPLQTLRAVTDDLLWSAYRLARYSVFPSLNEGFGLPVAESLVSGTPVVTSGHGSTLEIAEGGGALFVDPRDDDSVLDAMRRLLVDDDLHARLVGEARQVPVRSWDDYAAATWRYFVHDDGPSDPSHDDHPG